MYKLWAQSHWALRQLLKRISKHIKVLYMYKLCYLWWMVEKKFNHEVIRKKKLNNLSQFWREKKNLFDLSEK